MGAITTGNHPAALWPGVKAWWGRTYNEHKVEYTDLFDMETSTKNYEKDVQVTGFSLAPVKTEGGGTTYDSETQGYAYNYVHVAYGLGFIVTREERDDNLYEVVGKRRAQALAFSMRQTKETVAGLVYNRAFNSDYTFGDGKEIIATDHPSLAGDWANEPTSAADISEAAIEDMCILIMGMTNSKGLKINLMAQSLIVPRQLWFEANRILKSTLQSDSANNDPNVLRMTNAIPGGIKVNHYLTDTDAWFMRTNCPRGMIGYDRAKDDLMRDNDFSTDNALAKAYERYIFGVTDPRSIVGSPGV